LAALAARQELVATSAQLAAIGLSRHSVARRVAAGRFLRLHRGVFLVAPIATPLTPHVAAVLSLGDGAGLSHRSLLEWERVADPVPGRSVDVTIACTAARRRHGVRVHRIAAWLPGDHVVRRGLPAMSVTRALLAVASVEPVEAVERLVEEALLRGLTSQRRLDALLARAAGARGSGVLREALESTREPSITLSEAERILRRLLRRAGLPTPKTNERLGRYRPDFFWKAERVILEMDSWRFHGTRQAFERDRRRDQDLVAGGYVVLRATWRQIEKEPERVLARIAMAIARAGAA
jgi:very-short-patch-repair endonuclease